MIARDVVGNRDRWVVARSTWRGSSCGNGGRCLVAFARQLGVIKDKAVFEAMDGLHHASIEGDIVKLQMVDVDIVERYDNHVFFAKSYISSCNDNMAEMTIAANQLAAIIRSSYTNCAYAHMYLDEIHRDLGDIETISPFFLKYINKELFPRQETLNEYVAKMAKLLDEIPVKSVGLEINECFY